MDTAESIIEYIEQGLEKHQAGQLQEAEALYHKALEADENCADAYHLLGMLALDINNLDVAQELVLHAIDLDSSSPIYFNNLGNIFMHQGEFQAAEESFTKAIALKPDYIEAHYNLGNALIEQGRQDKAIDSFKDAINLNTNFTPAYINLGSIYIDRKHWDNALILFGKAMELDPQNPTIAAELAHALVEKGFEEKTKNIQSAMPYFERACNVDLSNSVAFLALAECYIALDQTQLAKQTYLEGINGNPVNADLYYNLGVINKQQGNLEEAAGRFQQAIAIDPNHYNAFYNLGNTLKELGDWEQALEKYDTALAIKPEDWPALVNKAVILQGLGRFEEALSTLKLAETINPQDFQIHNNLGMTLQSLNRVDDALQHYDQALILNPYSNEALWNKALVLLQKGDYEQGWPLYERRWELNEKLLNKKPSFEQPLWDGGDLSGKTILLCAEQGLGDSIQFVRYAALLKKKGTTKVMVQCQKGLETLFKTVVGVDQVYSETETASGFDTYIPLMSLPSVLHTTLESIPNEVPYCDADSALVEDWRDKLRLMSGYKVGIVWAGNPRKHDLANNLIDARRSCKLKDFKAIAKISGVKLISLQKGEASIQTIIENDGIDILDQTHAINNFADTAALIENLDLVISVDTSVVHLAGAMNKPVWLLSRFDGCWRWLIDRDDSPWYPSMRIFRQSKPGDWEELMQRVATELAQQIKR